MECFQKDIFNKSSILILNWHQKDVAPIKKFKRKMSCNNSFILIQLVLFERPLYWEIIKKFVLPNKFFVGWQKMKLLKLKYCPTTYKVLIAFKELALDCREGVKPPKLIIVSCLHK